MISAKTEEDGSPVIFRFIRSVGSGAAAIIMAALPLRSLAVESTAYAFSILAGQPMPSYADGPAAEAIFSYPQGMAFGPDGDLYVADVNNLAIRRISPTGVVSTYAGVPGTDQVRVDGPRDTARFQGPTDLAFDRDGNLFVGDRGSIRKITSAGLVTTVAVVNATSVAVAADGTLYYGDGATVNVLPPGGEPRLLAGGGRFSFGLADGTGSEARFNIITDIVIESDGNLLVADGNNSRIRRVSPSGIVTTFAVADDVYGLALDRSGMVYAVGISRSFIRISPNGAIAPVIGVASQGYIDGRIGTAQFGGFSAVAISSAGDLYLSDLGNRNIRRIVAGDVTTFAGMPGGATLVDGDAATARFRHPWAVMPDRAGNVYVADTGNFVIRKITPAGQVTTVAGRPGQSGFRDGPASQALFTTPTGIVTTSDGVVYILDNGATRRLSAGQVTYMPDLAGLVASDASDNLYLVRGYSLWRRSPQGTLLRLAGDADHSGFVDGVAAEARFGYFGQVVVGSDRSIYVTDGGNYAVRRIRPDGRVETIFAERSDPLSFIPFIPPSGVAVEVSGDVLVTHDRTIRRVAPSGMTTDVPGAPLLIPNAPLGLAPGSESNIRGIVMQPNGQLLLIDPWNDTVIRGEPTAPSRLTNISVRALVRPDDSTLIAGFSLAGEGAEHVLIRGIGPELRRFGLSGAHGDPSLAIYADGSLRGSNDDWGGTTTLAAAFAAAGAFELPRNSADAAWLGDFTGGGYTAHVTGAGSGDGLLEIYDLDPAGGPRLVNISGRGFVSAATGPLVAGFYISGRANKRIVVRGVGRTLMAYGVSNTMGANRLEVFNAEGKLVAENSNWAEKKSLSDLFARVGAFPLIPQLSDSALSADLPPGTYTAVLTSIDIQAGIGMLEVYDADQF